MQTSSTRITAAASIPRQPGRPRAISSTASTPSHPALSGSIQTPALKTYSDTAIGSPAAMAFHAGSLPPSHQPSRPRSPTVNSEPVSCSATSLSLTHRPTAASTR